MSELGRGLLVAGLALAALGGLMMLATRLPLGRLPGDIAIGGPNGSVFMLLATRLLLSALLTIALNLIGLPDSPRIHRVDARRRVKPSWGFAARPLARFVRAPR
ncbi:MAG: DUF2905 domain-containing protein [Candidatus Limnocylindrales bacterium]